MKKIILLVICLYLGGIIMSSALDKVEENIFKISSNDLINNELLPEKQVYKGYGCNGGNLSPELHWSNPPINTKSFALICHDPDAPKENGWYHWLVVNIPLSTTSIKQGEKFQNALETVTDFGSTGYNGACPPKGHGIHHYNFTIYALDVDKIDVKSNANPKDVEAQVLAHTIAKSTITALYERK